MIKKFALVLALAAVTAYSANVSFAAAPAAKNTVTVSPVLYEAVAKYKQQNYTGCIQDLKPLVKKEKDNSLVHYYLGISYAQLGMKDMARKAYNSVVELNQSPKLVEYSTRALACLDGQPECDPNYIDPATKENEEVTPEDEMNDFIKSGKFMHDEVINKVQVKSLDKVKDNINNDTAPRAQEYKYINDASKGQMKAPTDEEIANAVRVLAKVGFNPFAMNAAQYSNPQYAQLSAIMGNTNSNSNNMNNYLPYLLSQGANQNPEVTKQMMQSMMLNQMMAGFGGNSNGSF